MSSTRNSGVAKISQKDANPNTPSAYKRIEPQQSTQDTVDKNCLADTPPTTNERKLHTDRVRRETSEEIKPTATEKRRRPDTVATSAPAGDKPKSTTSS